MAEQNVIGQALQPQPAHPSIINQVSCILYPVPGTWYPVVSYQYPESCITGILCDRASCIILYPVSSAAANEQTRNAHTSYEVYVLENSLGRQDTHRECSDIDGEE